MIMKEELVVEFYAHKKSRDLYAVIGGSWNMKTGQRLEMYSHVGQHSEGVKGYVEESRLAYPDEYKDLLAELSDIYNDRRLKVWNTHLLAAYRQPTPAEIKLGEGCLHWRDFSVLEIGLNRQGQLKNRFKADDGLWYSRR